jgi:oxaloacetate decarboxylase alpha subunit
MSEEELLLRLTMPADQVDAMLAARRAEPRAPKGPRRRRSPWVTLLSELAARPDIGELSLQREDGRLEWRRA